MESVANHGFYAMIIDISRISSVMRPNLFSSFVNEEKRVNAASNHLTVCRRPAADILLIPQKAEDEEKFEADIFRERNSLLTDLFTTKDFKSVYNLCAAVAFCLYLHAVVEDLLFFGRVNLGLHLITFNFVQLPLLVSLWLCMQMATLSLYFLFNTWAIVRLQHLPCGWPSRLWDVTFCSLLIGFYTLFLAVPCYYLTRNDVPVAGAAGVLIEQVRFCVKVYSFLRTVLPRILACSSHNAECVCLSSLSKYLYFLFAPTLIYRDEYPRTGKLRKTFLLVKLCEIIVIILLLAFVLERYLLPPMRGFTCASYQLLAIISGSFLPSLTLFLLAFYSFYHSGYNIACEVSGFADRLSYRDWWNASSFGSFYRSWNVLVQNWLYLYVYKDSYLIFRSRTFSNVLVFLVSAVIHDYVLTFSFGFFYPVLSVMFGLIGMTFVFLPNLSKSFAMGNLTFWVLHSVGSGIMNSLYMSEYYARSNCPLNVESPVLDFFVPRSWYCTCSR